MLARRLQTRSNFIEQGGGNELTFNFENFSVVGVDLMSDEGYEKELFILPMFAEVIINQSVGSSLFVLSLKDRDNRLFNFYRTDLRFGLIGQLGDLDSAVNPVKLRVGLINNFSILNFDVNFREGDINGDIVGKASIRYSV